jgi:hypothetical protein
MLVPCEIASYWIVAKAALSDRPDAAAVRTPSALGRYLLRVVSGNSRMLRWLGYLVATSYIDRMATNAVPGTMVVTCHRAPPPGPGS